MLSWARTFGVLRRAGVECTGFYGAALTRFPSQESIQVVEVNQPDRALRRRRGKTDAVDAEAAARAVLSGRAGDHRVEGPASLGQRSSGRLRHAGDRERDPPPGSDRLPVGPPPTRPAAEECDVLLLRRLAGRRNRPGHP
nr:hypothetical protein [Streptomyces sp. MUSC 14]